VWRIDAECYLNILLGLLAASQCSWEDVMRHINTAEDLGQSTGRDALKIFLTYLKGVYCQGTGDFNTALSHFRDPLLSVDDGQQKQYSTSQRHLALLAGMNQLWIMQSPSHQDMRMTMELLNELEPLCRDHPNIEIRGAWYSILATVSTNPPRQRNQRKEDVGRALPDIKRSGNALAITIGLVIARDLLYNNVLGDQAWKCMQAAAFWAKKSSSPLWKSVVDGILAEFSEAKNEKDQAQMFWNKGVEEAEHAFSRSS
jgi:hypothetical protein